MNFYSSFLIRSPACVRITVPDTYKSCDYHSALPVPFRRLFYSLFLFRCYGVVRLYRRRSLPATMTADSYFLGTTLYMMHFRCIAGGLNI